MTARSLRALLWIALAVLPGPAPAGAQSEDELGALNRETLQLLEASKRPDPIAAAAAAVADAEKRFDPDRPDVADAVSILAGIDGKYDAAEPLYERALAIQEKVIEGEAMHGNQLWQPFAVFMARDGAAWTLRSVRISGPAFK